MVRVSRVRIRVRIRGDIRGQSRGTILHSFTRTHFSETACPNFTEFSVCVACGRGSVLL